MPRVNGIVLAAGSGSRMGQPKATMVVRGARLVDRAVSVLRGAGCADVMVVARSGIEVPGVRVLVNPDADRGMRSSLLIGVVMADQDADALAVMLVDTPGITEAAARGVVEAWQPGRIAVASYAGRRGHPIVMAPGFWRRAIDLAGPDEGARTFLSQHSDAVDEVVVDGDPTDLDTPEDLARYLS